ncbi:MAG TPA: hypothetical protein VGO47_02640 [Chlamydiales bacterium]|nr:hypothetical protein [Chlamydiales bacterium]
MRVHIAKALKTRSKAIRTAVELYNQMAMRVDPPRPSLDVAQVLEHVFLAEFDILRDSCYQVQQQPWSRAAEQEARTIYYKIQRANEEVSCLNVEVRQLQTYMRNEERFMACGVEQIRENDPALASQLENKLTHLQALNKVHYARISQIHQLSYFSGLRTCGIREGTTAEEIGEVLSTVSTTIYINLATSFILTCEPLTKLRELRHYIAK